MGGEELPDDVQDRPEQNAGYDAAAHGDVPSPTRELADDLAIDPTSAESRDLTIRDVPDELEPAERESASDDDRAARDAAGEVRFRERRRR